MNATGAGERRRTGFVSPFGGAGPAGAAADARFEGCGWMAMAVPVYRGPSVPPPRTYRLATLAMACAFFAASCTTSPPTAPDATVTPPPGGPSTARPSGGPSLPPIVVPTQPGATPSAESPAPGTASPGTPLPTDPASPAPTEPIDPLAQWPTTISPELSATLQAVVDRERAAYPAPGLSVAIRLPSGETWTGVSGNASLSPDRPVTPETVFAVASITKTFVASLILQLAEEGALSLDDPLSDFVPDFDRAPKVTIRQLLSHTSGIHDYFISGRYREQVFADRKRVWTFDEILDFVLRPYCKPGRCYHYSNTNFVLLGRVAERATGNTVADELRRRFFEPLGLAHTVFQPDQATPEDAAHGHLISPGGGFTDHTGRSSVIPTARPRPSPGRPEPSPRRRATWSRGRLRSTAGTSSDPNSLAQMTDFSAVPEYGLGTRYLSYLGHSAVGHLGGIRGFVSTVAYFPESGVSIAVTVDRGMINPQRALKRVLAALLSGG